MFAACIQIAVLPAACGELRNPDASVEFVLEQHEKSLFVEIIKEFAVNESLSIEDIGDEVPTVGPGSIFFILRRGEDLEIYIANVNKPTKFNIGIFDYSGSGNWEPLWAALMTRLNKAWPGRFPLAQDIG